MKKLITLVKSDLQQILRDTTLRNFLWTPVILVLVVRYGVPALAEQFPIIVDYYSLISMFGSLQTAVMFGFISSFIILDEKDQNVLQVLRILPISPLTFIIYRLGFATFFSSLGALAMITLGGLAFPGWSESFMLSLQFGLTAPFITLIIASFAKNKIEGMAYFKVIDLFLLLPVLSFFITGWTQYIFAIIPAYWSYHLYDLALLGESLWLFFSMGTLVYFAFLWILYKQFRARVFG